jgi:hypothetical protein
MHKPETAPTLSATAPKENLPAMNEEAAKSSGGAGGVTPCKKSWFAILLSMLDENGKESYLPDVTVKLKVGGVGEVQRVSMNSPKPIKLEALEPGGKGDVLQLQHATDVYEASGDFS